MKKNPVFKTVDGFEGLYKISENGDVVSYPREVKYPSGKIEVRPGRVMKPIVRGGGAKYFKLTARNGKVKGFRLDQLLEKHFGKTI